jgi:hypothetical protein
VVVDGLHLEHGRRNLREPPRFSRAGADDTAGPTDREGRHTERAKVDADLERGEVGRYGVGDNTGYGGPGI